jgi:hypothetical protein
VDSAGNVYVADYGNDTIREITPGGVVTTLAGKAGQAGSTDGTGAAARFTYPAGVAVDSAGNLYVADAFNDTIRKITPAGAVTTLAGTVGVNGSTDGTGAAARFSAPSGVAMDGAGNLYVADAFNDTIRKITPAGVVTTLAGSPGQPGSADGTGAAARFYNPQGVAVDSAGNVYVVDSGNDTIREITPAGVVTTLAGTAGQAGSTDGTGAAAEFSGPSGVAVDAAGNVYVADSFNDTIREITPGGVVTTLAGMAGQIGSADGIGAAAQFNGPTGLAVDAAGNLYVTDTNNIDLNGTIRKVSIPTVLAQSGVTGTNPVSESATLTGLQPNTTYYYQAVATNSVGSADGAIFSFTTTTTNTPSPTTTTLTSSANPSTVGQAVSFTAVVAPQSGTGTPIGNVVFDIDGSATTTTLPLSVVNGVDEAILTTSTLTAGSHGITAQYQGDGNFSASPATAITQVVNPDPTTTLPATAITNTSATLNGSINPNGISTNALFQYSTNPTISAVVTTLAGDGWFNSPTGEAVDSAGNLYVADTTNDTIDKVTPGGVVTILAGTAGQAGSTDGTGAAARFRDPSGVAVDSAGNVYVADTTNDTIRKITPAGVVTTLAGSPLQRAYADGTGAAARFTDPSGVAVDGAGNVYVADTTNDTIRKITPGGVVTTLAGTPRVTGSADGTGAAARFNFPYGVAVDSAGNVYVADSNNDTIRKITPAGVVTTLAGTAGVTGSGDGTGAAAQFNDPSSVAVDAAGNVYVADSNNDTIRKIMPAGVVTTLAGTAGQAGSTNGTGAAAEFNDPQGVAVDSAGNVYVADSNNDTIRKITPAGVVTTLAGTPGVAGSVDSAASTGAAAEFNFLSGAAVDGAGNVYVAANDAIDKITPAGVVTILAGTPGVSDSADGTGAAAQFGISTVVAVDAAGNVYVMDSSGGFDNITDAGDETIRKITPAGVVTTLAGSAVQRAYVNGTGAAARFYDLGGAALDAAGNLYVADFDTIREITPAGVVTTLAGSPGQVGSADGTGAAAEFNDPTGVAVDAAGNVYVADTGNDTIRKITPAGVVTTLAGTAGVAGRTDGTGAAARFNDPTDVAVDSAGNVYVADYGNDTIREITPAGVVTTLAGTPGVTGSADGIGAAAEFSGPSGVTVDSAGNLYVTDLSNSGYSTIRKVSIPTVLAQSGVTGTNPVSESATLTGLQPNTTYYYRAVATGPAGSTNGAILSFTTVAPTPLITTTASEAGNVAGSAVLTDTAHLTGGSNPTGTITFNLYNNPNATGTPLFTDTETLSGGTATSKGYTAAATGTDYWVATYNGDSNNSSVSSGAASEPVTITPATLATPSINTQQQPASAKVGTSIADKATVSGGNNPTGTVTFNLYNNPNGTGTLLFTDANEPLVNGTATSKGYTATATGTDYWVATYNGDSKNNSVTSGTALEPVVISPASPSIVTASNPTRTVNVGNTATTVTDTAVVSGGYHETGNLVFTLSGPGGFTSISTTVALTGTGNGTYTVTNTLKPSSTPIGTYTWTVTYKGDANNNSANDQGGSAEQFTIQNVVAKNEAATMGFWANTNGQALLKTYGTALGYWLGTTYPNLFGNLANTTTPANSATGTQIAAYFITAKNAAGGLIGNTYAQVLATALNVWVTTTGLGWNTSPTGPTKYGFAQGFGGAGLGSILYNVGSNGASFGVANNTYQTVNYILSYLNSKTTVTTPGSITKLPVLYFYSKTDTTLTNGASNVLSGINQAGDLS